MADSARGGTGSVMCCHTSQLCEIMQTLHFLQELFNAGAGILVDEQVGKSIGKIGLPSSSRLVDVPYLVVPILSVKRNSARLNRPWDSSSVQCLPRVDRIGFLEEPSAPLMID